MIVVSNSSPLIYLAALADFELLPALFGEIHIPEAVWKEVVERGSGFPVQLAVRSAAGKWLHVHRLLVEPIHVQGDNLHAGETGAIRLAEQCRADILLMDDRLAVAHARSIGLHVIPTIAIYMRAKQIGVIKSVKERVDRLRETRFRLSEDDYQTVLKTANEE